MRKVLLASVLLGVLASRAVAHEGLPPAPHDVWSAWSWEPAVLLGIVAAAVLYGRGVYALWARAGRGRGVKRTQAAAFAVGLFALFVALVSPLDAMGSALFSAHMAQHEVLILAAAPLLVLGAPLLPFLWAMPIAWRRRVGGWARHRGVRRGWQLLVHPLTAWTVHAAALWVWHAPALYQRTLTSEWVHIAQHASFLGSALLFWWALLHSRHRMGHGLGVLYLFTAAAQGSLLGALLTFARAPWYPAYAQTAGAWGLTPLEDQQLGGLLMWIPPGILYLVVALGLFAAWLRQVERRAARAEQRWRRATTAAALLLLLAGCGAGEVQQSVLRPAGEQAERVASLWWLMFTLGGLVWVVVTAALLYAVTRARAASAEERTGGDARKRRVVVGAVAVTLAILLGVFAASLATGRAESTTREPGDVLTIEVVGYRFWWGVRYMEPGSETPVVDANEIHMPLGRPVLFRVRSADVIHSFWVPNLHGKIDMIPGRENTILVRATEPGVFRGQCAEFCGVQHANMAFAVVVQPEDEFRAWMNHQRRPARTPTDTTAAAGQRVFLESGCADCHAIRGTPADAPFGPDLTHLASRLTLAAGILPNTRGHLGGWIANPQRIKPGNNMPYVPLTAEEFRALLHYLETLQ